MPQSFNTDVEAEIRIPNRQQIENYPPQCADALIYLARQVKAMRNANSLIIRSDGRLVHSSDGIILTKAT